MTIRVQEKRGIKNEGWSHDVIEKKGRVNRQIGWSHDVYEKNDLFLGGHDMYEKKRT